MYIAEWYKTPIIYLIYDFTKGNIVAFKLLKLIIKKSFPQYYYRIDIKYVSKYYVLSDYNLSTFSYKNIF